MLRRTGVPAWGGLALLACLLLAQPVEAQIYTWYDANGTLNLSNLKKPDDTDVKTFAVPKADNIRVTRYAAADRSTRYEELIAENAQQNGVRADLVRAVVQVESAFNPFARSVKGALGLMQLMPATIRQYGVTNPFDPVQNIRAGVAYLRDLLDRYQNNESLALAAYNAGPGAVDKYGQSVPPYRETKNYVAHINQISGRPLELRGASRIYKVIDIIDGQPKVRYTDKRPATGAYELVK